MTNLESPYQERIERLRQRKLEQTRQKIETEGLLDEDDYGRVVPPRDLWHSIANHPDGSFYGLNGWAENFCSLMDVHPLYIDPDDAFAGRWMYFMSRMRKNKWHPDYPYHHLEGNIQKYDIIPGIGDDAHFAPDFRMGLSLGWKGILAKIEKYRKINHSPGSVDFYNAHERVIHSIQGWIQRHADEALSMAGREDDPLLKANLLEMARVNRKVISEPPANLREALQWMIWYHLASRTYNRDGAGGQIDELLRPFYENDVNNGIISRDTAIYYLACFLINDPVYWQLGGPDKDGRDMTSEISFLILEAAEKINTSLNITVRVHDGMNNDLFRKAVSCLVKYRNGWPRFSGDKALVEGFMRNGFSAELARERIAVGCNWMSLPGLEYTMNDLVKVNMARVFEISYHEMVRSGEGAPSTERLWEIFIRHLDVAVHTAAEGIRHHLRYQKFNEPELVLNLLSHGPLEKGLDVSDGGAAYYNLAIDGAGLAVVADSFAALQQRIEEEKKISWEEMTFHLDSNFEEVNGERIRYLLKNSSRFGKGHSIGDTGPNGFLPHSP